MECRHARMLLEVAHPLATELEASETEALAAHLADCPECGSWAEAERRVDEKLGAAMRDVPTPVGLQQRLLGRLQAERDAWYRGWLIRAAGAAAAVLLVCWIGYVAWFAKRPALNWEEVKFEVDQVASSKEDVEQAFAAKGVIMLAPPKFDYHRLAGYGIAVLQNKQVPYLVFVAPSRGNGIPVTAQVYVLSASQFTLDAARNSLPTQGSYKNILVLQDPNNPHVLWLVVYSRDVSVTAFFQRNEGAN